MSIRGFGPSANGYVTLDINRPSGTSAWKKPGTQPGTFSISRQAPMTVTRRFERPE